MTAARKPAAKPPRKASKPLSVVAREAEADDGHVTVEQCGVTLRIPVGGKVTLAAIDLFRVGDSYGGTKEMLGVAQWTRLSAAGATADDLDELGEKLREISGN